MIEVQAIWNTHEGRYEADTATVRKLPRSVGGTRDIFEHAVRRSFPRRLRGADVRVVYPNGDSHTFKLAA